MKKILAVLVAAAFIFTLTPAAFAGKALIPFWQNGGNVTTLISVVSSDGSAGQVSYTSTGATIRVTLYAADSSGNFTISPTNADGQAAATTGQTFATATFRSVRGGVMMVDTAQLGSQNWATRIWTTSSAWSSSAAKFGFGVVDTGTSGSNEHSGWVAVYGGTNPAGFTVQLYDAANADVLF